ncbi:unnamed protein product, partial [Mesorhabditis belari]|uniref:Uncharacterized protein n=1 Tax=Mesorhabditis belari TaxID=2138241 RepID=A0A915F0H2_9BILA
MITFSKPATTQKIIMYDGQPFPGTDQKIIYCIYLLLKPRRILVETIMKDLTAAEEIETDTDKVVALEEELTSKFA